ncbi:amidase [Amycolatopsis acidicola]|uniref:Amidase n=1 Tax=Amycolatopsis acidicola TaxID=2596893 RepID=A0A5N0VGE4_9PSEU|nr:amidase [Amycolatopsis acidicola]KAA9164463.1 amidase [Amycolatopsis acidicola]
MIEYLTITGALAGLESGRVTSVELTEQALEAADRLDAALGVFVSRFPDSALAAAQEADKARAGGVSDRPLLGIPLGVKDIITTQDGETTGQSLVLDRAWGSGDATVVQRLRAAGALVVGKTTTMEFALGAPDPEKPFPLPRNPWDPGRWSGGSSSGSGAGVAAGMFLGALGTDTGASVRMPAALCGVTGLKPTFGRVPKSGCVPLGYTLDCVGPLAPSARDCAALLAVMAGHGSCPWSAERAVPDFTAGLDGDLSGLQIGVDDLTRYSSADPALAGLFADFVATLEKAGAIVRPVELPRYREVTAAAVVSIVTEALTYHAPDIRTRWSDYGASTRAALGFGAFVSGADYVQAQRVRAAGRKLVGAVFEDVDLIVTPLVTRPAPYVGDAAAYTATLFAGQDFAYHTAYWNSLGNPALSVPIGFGEGNLPLAAQIVGPHFAEATVLRAGDAFQSRTEWHLRRPGEVKPSQAPAPAAAPESAPRPDPTADSLLRMAGLTVPEEERGAVAAALPMVRYNTDLLYTVPETRYEDPLSPLAVP